MAFGEQKSLGARRRSSRRPLLIFLAISLALLLIVNNRAAIVQSTRQIASDIAVPLTYVATLPVVIVRDTIINIFDFVSLRQTNKKLLAENERLSSVEGEVAGLKVLVRRYESFLKVQLPKDYDAITARILANTGGGFVRTIVINADYDSGVRVGDAVIGTRGFIGRVVSVGVFSSRVLLMTDLNSRIPVRIEPIGKNAIMSGNNTDTPRLEYLSDKTDIVNGMRIVASGLGGELPAGLAIGRLRMDRNNVPEVIPEENFNNLDFVRVLHLISLQDEVVQALPEALVEEKTQAKAQAGGQ